MVNDTISIRKVDDIIYVVITTLIMPGKGYIDDDYGIRALMMNLCNINCDSGGQQ